MGIVETKEISADASLMQCQTEGLKETRNKTDRQTPRQSMKQ
jgi:hypothetical protein